MALVGLRPESVVDVYERRSGSEIGVDIGISVGN
jgi:hypothetical protein